MSSAARWSYTAIATLWVLVRRADWDGELTFAAPVTIPCDYQSEAKTARDAKGEEFVTQLLLYTERADIKRGDRVMLGAQTAADPIAAGALEVRAIKRNADVFDRNADDFEILS